jgi:hypothetical protein
MVHMNKDENISVENDPQMVLSKWGAVDITTVVVSRVSRDPVQHGPT